jgi:hypothetical protein
VWRSARCPFRFFDRDGEMLRWPMR